MTGNLLTEVDGWTPLIDLLTKELGLVTSAVYGRMWRFCQGADRVCNASLDTIASDLHVDKATVMRHAKKLCKEGYIIDMTPHLRNAPHTYALTEKIKIYAKIGVAQNNTIDESVAENNVTLQSATQTVAESKLKKDIKKDSKILKDAPKAKPLDHPALQVYKANTGINVPNNWKDEVTGSVTDFEKWATTIKEWMGRGWNKGNVKGMLEVYKDGFSKNGYKPTPPKRQPPEMTPQEIAAELKKGRQK